MLCSWGLWKPIKPFETHRQNEILYAYLIERAQADIKSAVLVGEQNKAASTQLSVLDETLEAENRRQDKLQDERNIMQAELPGNEQAKILVHIRTQITDKEKQITALREEFSRFSTMFSKNIASWRTNTNGFIQKIQAVGTTSRDACLILWVQSPLHFLLSSLAEAVPTKNVHPLEKVNTPS